MRHRKVKIFTGEVFRVPEHIVRADSRKTHGWQVRYGESTVGAFFSDHSNNGAGAQFALDQATHELIRRIRHLEAPTGLKKMTLGWKKSTLPLGVSGPAPRLRPGRKLKTFYFQVTVPRFGDKPRNASIYIATEQTLSQEKYDAALGKALAVRQSAVVKYQADATRTIRARYSRIRKMKSPEPLALSC